MWVSRDRLLAGRKRQEPGQVTTDNPLTRGAQKARPQKTMGNDLDTLGRVTRLILTGGETKVSPTRWIFRVEPKGSLED